MPTIHDTLDSKSVVAKLNEYDITPNTTFVSWGDWHFDVSLLREWLDAEGHHDVLPNNESVFLLLEFRGNLDRILGQECFQGRSFPLKLPFVFPLLFRNDDPLAGRNHNAIVDALQLSQMTNLYFDLVCNPPGERVIWKGSEAADPWFSHKRQMSVDSFYDPSRSAKKRKLS